MEKNEKMKKTEKTTVEKLAIEFEKIFDKEIKSKELEEYWKNKNVVFDVKYFSLREDEINKGYFYGRILCWEKDYAWPSVSLPCKFSLIKYKKIKELQKQKNKQIIVDNGIYIKAGKKTFKIFKFDYD